MRFHYFVFFSQCMIFWNRVSDVKAIIGPAVRPAREGEYPYVVSLMRVSQTPDPENDHECTGTLISNRDVLTAEHCVEYDSVNVIKVNVGSQSLSAGITYAILWWKTYEDWCKEKDINLEVEINDIAIIRLTRNVSQPIIPIPISTQSNPRLYGSNVMMPGWGIVNNNCIPDKLQTVALKIIPNRQCEQIALKLEGVEVPLHVGLLCTLGNPFALMQCGDSGGPLVYENTIVAVNGGTFPLPDDDVHPEKVNLHFSIDYYRQFVTDILRNY